MASSLQIGRQGVSVSRFGTLCLIFVFILMTRELWHTRPPFLRAPMEHGDDIRRVPVRDVQEQFLIEDADNIVVEDLSCLDVPGANKVLVIMKTGSTELYQKLPVHFVTTFKCITHLRIYSDLPQTFADMPVYDAISLISEDYRVERSEFDFHRRLQRWHANGQDVSRFSGQTSWNLDKWKFLPMLHDTFEVTASDDIDWYVVMEADTSISWSNLLLWLRTMDSTESYYLGAQNVISDTYFAHGGSGIVISRGAADRLQMARHEAGHELYDEKWQEVTQWSCCGDKILAQAFRAVDIPLMPAWPLIQGEKISSIDWTRDHWCAPAVSWHHVSPTDVHEHWAFQDEWVREHGWESPYLFRDVFKRFVEPHIMVNQTNWNNLSMSRRVVAAALATADDESTDDLDDYEARAVETAAKCAEVCVQAGRDECVQWMFMPGRCYLGKVLRLGSSDEAQSEHWTSGWLQEHVVDFMEEMEGCATRWSG